MTLGLLMSGGAVDAATWRLTPSVSGQVEYTDNVRGATSGAESDLIFTTTPGLNVTANGARLQLNLQSSVQFEEYLDTDGLSGYAPRVLGAANAELYEDILFFDASSSLRRNTINRNAATGASDRSVGSNQSDVLNLRGGPTVRFRMGPWAQSESRLTASRTMYDPLSINDDPAAGSTASDATLLSAQQTFTSGRRFRMVNWSLTGSESQTKRDDGDTFTRRNVEGEASYALDRLFVPNIRVGRDYNDDNSLDGGEDFGGFYWLVGFTSRPGPRTTVSFSVGRRFDDVTYDGSLNYRFSSALQLRANYSESVTTQQEQVGDPFEFVATDEFGNLIDTRTGLPIDPSDPAFDQTFADAVFRSRTFALGISGTRLRNDYSLSLTRSQRDTGGAVSRESVSTGINASFARRLSPRLRLSLTGSANSTTDDLGADTQRYQLGTTLNYTLGEGLTSSLSVRHFERRSDGPGDNDLTENSVVVSVRKTF